MMIGMGAPSALTVVTKPVQRGIRVEQDARARRQPKREAGGHERETGRGPADRRW